MRRNTTAWFWERFSSLLQVQQSIWRFEDGIRHGQCSYLNGIAYMLLKTQWVKKSNVVMSALLWYIVHKVHLTPSQIYFDIKKKNPFFIYCIFILWLCFDLILKQNAKKISNIFSSLKNPFCRKEKFSFT